MSAKQLLIPLVLFPVLIAACTTSQPKNEVYLPTILLTPTGIPATEAPPPSGLVQVNPPTPVLTSELVFPTNDPNPMFGTLIAGQLGQSLTQTAGSAVEAARGSLAQTMGVSLDQIGIVNVEDVTWPDMCFGIPGAFADCPQFMMPGYRITLRINGLDYLYYTNMDGTRILLANQP